MKLHLIRHGESILNAEGRIQGHLEIPLSALGRRQADAAGKKLIDLSLDALYASPLCRARETAEIIAARLNLPVQFDDRLKEINVGIFQGKTPSELEKLYPEEFRRWKSEDFDFVLPRGESRRLILQRGREALKSIVSDGYQNIAIVSHGRILMTIIKDLLGMPLKDPPHSVQNGSITTLTCMGDQFELVALDCVDHLHEVGLSGSGDL